MQFLHRTCKTLFLLQTSKKITPQTTLLHSYHSFQFHRRLCTSIAAATTAAASPPSPVNESHLLRVCTILYQQQNSPESKLHTSLCNTDFDLTHEFFFQVCNKFPYSWKPVYKLHQYAAASQPHFRHTSATFNKMLDVVGKARNLDLFWDLLQEIGNLGLANMKTFIIGSKVFAESRELRKCVEMFHVMNGFGHLYNVETLNKVVESLCKSKHVAEANHLVLRLRKTIKPNGITYRWLIYGFCDIGSLFDASKIWNHMTENGIEPDIETVGTMLEILFKNNKLSDALTLFQSLRVKDLAVPASTYHIVIKWFCNKGKLEEARMVFDEMLQMVFDEMLQRGLEPESDTLGSIVFALVTKGRVDEGYMIVKGVKNPDIGVYHGLIKGLVKLKRPSEATEVFREMIKKGCEPTMHTYVMLLQGHLGKRGRKGCDPLVNFDTIFVGGLVTSGKSLEATKYVERILNGGIEVPRFDYNKFLHCFSNEEGVAMFEGMARKLREVGLFDLGDIFARYGSKMATRDRRRDREVDF